MYQSELRIQTYKRDTHNISRDIDAIVCESGVNTGLCHVFVKHTSCSLFINENADPRVQTDLETLIRRIAPDGDPAYIHNDEGPDDMPAHFRSIVTGTELTMPIRQGRLDLGTWQGVFLWEHRTHPHIRHLTITCMGE